MMIQVVDYLKNLDFASLFIYAVIVNFGLYIISIAIFYLVDKIGENPLQTNVKKITTKDILISIMTLGINILVFIIGFYLWKSDIIILSFHTSLIRIIMEILIFIMAMDFLMYCFHRMAHHPKIYSILHRQHHQHVQTNALSLFVMHPLESFGFGLMMIGVIMCIPFSIISVVLYLTINLLWGTIGHLNKSMLSNESQKQLINYGVGTTLFHHQHHEQEHYNFGFYTTFWDKIFRTLNPK